MGKKSQRKRAESSSDDGAGSESDDELERRDVDGDDDDELGEEDVVDVQRPQRSLDSEDDGGDNDDNADAATSSKPKKVRKLKLTATQDFNAKLKKRGVVYLSRIPPRMGPSKVKTLLSDFGTVTRIYLVEEDKTARKKRRKAGGSGGKRYTEGWAEFESKKLAKLAGETLNMTRVANKKGSIHYDDLWNVKYLRGFRWSHLTEKVAYERRVREQKLRVEMMEVRRENAAYVAQVEAGKRLDYIEDRRRKRGEKDGGAKEKKRRKIRQKRPFEGDGGSAKSAILGSLV